MPATRAEALALLAEVVAEARRSGTPTGLNVVALSGGVDSSLALVAAAAAFGAERCVAVLGVSAAVPPAQRAAAREAAEHAGVALLECETKEGDAPLYVENDGRACYACKTELYAVLRAAAGKAREERGASNSDDVVLFNGTNADDLLDPTRLGLVAAAEARVASPLAALPKAAVRAVAKAAGLPNWDLAAQPCLRSRLAFGVEATPERLIAVGNAEAAVRARLAVGPTENLRVRVLLGAGCAVEVDAGRLDDAHVQSEGLRADLASAGLELAEVRAFRSGALSLPDP